MKTRKKIHILTSFAMLTAAQIVLSRFLSIQTPIMKFSFAFVPVMLAGALYGWCGGAAVGALSDLVGALLFPSGQFFPGYTITAMLSGAIFGLFLHGKHGIAKIIIAYALNAVAITLFLNALCIAYTMGGWSLNGIWVRYWAGMPKRLLQAAIMLVIQVVITHGLLNGVKLDDRIRKIL